MKIFPRSEILRLHVIPQIKRRTLQKVATLPHSHCDSVTDVIPESVKISLRLFQNELVRRASPEKIVIMVVGAIANAFFGRPRFSRDLDIAVALGDEESREVLFSIIKNPHLYTIIYPDRQSDKGDPSLDSASDFDKVNLIKLRDKETGIIIDILLVSQNQYYGLQWSSFERVNKVDLGDGYHTRISIPSPEDFILMKLVARRPLTQDFNDMFMVMVRNYATLDWTYLQERARELNLGPLLSSYKAQAEKSNEARSE